MQATSAELTDDAFDPLHRAEKPDSMKTANEKLVSWVMSRVSRWKQHRNGNYETNWNSYELAFRGMYEQGAKTRESERSKLVSPATSEAVENSVAEIEEAAFGRGDFFDMWSEASDPLIYQQALNKNEINFKEDLAKTRFTSTCAEIVLLGGIYGTGIGEILLEKKTEHSVHGKMVDVPVEDENGNPVMGPDGQPLMKQELQPVVTDKEVERPCLKAVSPRNFIIDPAAKNIDDALGVAVEEDVGSHIINAGMASGDYNKVKLGTGAGDLRTKPDQLGENPWNDDVVPTIRYYGKVPKHLLFPPAKTEALFPEDEEERAEPKSADNPFEEAAEKSIDPIDAELVEAWVVIADGEHLLKAIEAPDMMKDRPVIAYQWDVIPNRFWGRGICEKGLTPQRLLDAELRARVDALAFVAAPMMAMDASRLPRGFKLEVYPGKNVLLAGDPSEILKPFKFGELDANSAQQVELLDRMHQRATGSVDSAGLAQSTAEGQSRSGAMSMGMTGIVKRNKRTLQRYINDFLSPVLRKLLWRYMQYDTPRYTPVNTSFNVASTMGIMQREYETAHLSQVMASMQPDTPEYLMLLKGVVSNSGIQQRDQIAARLEEKIQRMIQAEQQPPVDPNAQPPVDPAMLELQRQDALLELAKKRAEIAKLTAEAGLTQAKTQSEMLEPSLRAQEIATKGIYKTPEDRINEEFDRRIRMAELALEREQTQSDERIAQMQTGASVLGHMNPKEKIVPVEKPFIVEQPVPAVPL